MLEAAKAHPHYSAPLEGPNRGRGVAAGYWHNSTGPASATVSVNADGTVSLVEGSVDIGGSRAAAAMHVAEVLGLPYEDVKPTIGDTESIGFTSHDRRQQRHLQNRVGLLSKPHSTSSGR